MFVCWAAVGRMDFMLFRKCLPFLAVVALFSSIAAKAQLALYGTFNGERVNGFTCQATNGACASPDGTVRPFGGNFGAYYDFRNLGPVRLGADLRGDVFSANKSAVEYQGGAGINKFYGVLGGVRASIGVPIPILHPYAEALVGYARTNAASANVGTFASSTPTNIEIYSGYTQVQGVIGLDIAVLPFLDLRAIELGGGSLFGSSTHSIESIGAGVVIHLSR